MLAIGVERARWALFVPSVCGVGGHGSEGGQGKGGQLEQGVAEADLMSVGTQPSGWHGALPCLSDPSPHTLHCLEGDAPWPLTGWVFVLMWARVGL